MEKLEKIENNEEHMKILNQPNNYLRIAIVGNVDSGKSTLVGVLTKGLLDNGRGLSRMKIFNYSHEMQTGRTSSIAQEIMGFDKDNLQIFAKRFVQKKNKYWQQVIEKAEKVITLVDLCGHEKYLKTTMLGMVGLAPDYALIVVGANFGLNRMTKEHLGIALVLKIPFFFVITKVDMIDQEVLKKTLFDLQKILKSNLINKKPLIIEYEEVLNQLEINKIHQLKEEEEERKTNVNEKVSAKEEEMLKKTISLMKSGEIAPIFQISSISNFGLKQLTFFLKNLFSRNDENPQIGKANDPVEFDIHEKFIVVGTGLVVSGILRSGTLKTNTNYLLGPSKDNIYSQVFVKTIHFNRQSVEKALPGFFCCVALRQQKKKEPIEKELIRKGSVLLDITINPIPIWGFDATIQVLHHSTTIMEGYESVMHCGIIRQCVKIIKMEKGLLRTGDNDVLKFRFMYNSEYLKENMVFLLREGRTKILGNVLKVYYDKNDLKIKQFYRNQFFFISYWFFCF